MLVVPASAKATAGRSASMGAGTNRFVLAVILENLVFVVAAGPWCSGNIHVWGTCDGGFDPHWPDKMS